MIQQAGIYAAHLVDAFISKNDYGRPVLELTFELDGAPGETIRSWHTLVSSDNAINTKGIALLRKAYPAWDGVDPYWFEDNVPADPVELDIEMKPRADGNGETPKVKWINHPRGSGGAGQHRDQYDRAAFMAEFGSKLRANAGVSAKAAPPRPAPVQMKKPPAPPPAPRPAPVQPKPAASSQNSAWELCIKLTPDSTDAQREELWFKTIDDTGKDQADMDPADWAKVEDALKAACAGAHPPAEDDDVEIPF